jgi:hypothetical protein
MSNRTDDPNEAAAPPGAVRWFTPEEYRRLVSQGVRFLEPDAVNPDWPKRTTDIFEAIDEDPRPT